MVEDALTRVQLDPLGRWRYANLRGSTAALSLSLKRKEYKLTSP